MIFKATKAKVFNRGIAPDSFLLELVEWGKTAPEDIFAVNANADIYGNVRAELGPWTGILHRRAAMLEVMRVLAGFESSWNWNEGIDTSRSGDDSPAKAEAGAWQVSADSIRLGSDLKKMFDRATKDVKVNDGGENIGGMLIHAQEIEFQRVMKNNHPFAMEYVARLLRVNTKHNGPLYKGEERIAIRPSLRDPKHSIYPWLSRDAVKEFEGLLA